METCDIINIETGEIIYELKSFNEFIPIMARDQLQIVPAPDWIESWPNEVYVKERNYVPKKETT